MKIGIDARFLTHPQRGGFKTHTCSLIAALSGNPAGSVGNEYILYTDRPTALDERLPANFTIRPIIGNFPAREQIILPLQMLRDGVRVAHFPCNTAPVLYPGIMVVTIHDAISIRRGAGSDRRLPLKRRLLHSYWRWVIPRCARKASLVMTVSEFSAEELRTALHLRADRVRVVYNSIDPIFRNGASSIPLMEIGTSGPFLLAFASADGRKNEKRTMAAYRHVSLDFPGLKLVMVCPHSEARSGLEEKAGDGIIPVGPVPIEQLCRLYREARALVFPSLNEGFGLPPIEAMASGTPVVASQRGALPEVLGNAAVFVDPEDEESIAEGIKSVLGDESLRDSLKIRGLAKAELFTQERMAGETIRVYREAAEG